MINYIQSLVLSILFLLIVHSLPSVVVSQEFKLLDNSRNRVILNKVLPPSPSNLDRTVKIPLSFSVLPNGTVGEVIPLSKGDPSLEVVSIKTLKKWKFNPIEDDIVMKGEITFTFSPEGGNYTPNKERIIPTINKLDEKKKEKYYSVNHHHWGAFLNNHAVWIDEGTLSQEGILYKMIFSTEYLEKGIYNYEYSADDSEEVYFDGVSIKNFIDNQNSEKGKLFLHEGIHKFQILMRNSVINKQLWRDNPAGFAFTLTNERGQIVFSTRDEKHCYKRLNNPKYYPVSHPVWNDLLKNHAVWINNKEKIHEGEYKDLTFEITIPKSGFYNFEISADDTAEFLLDGNKIMDISYQKGIHNFKIKLEEGAHQLQMKVMNFTLYKSNWEENAVGVAILIKDNLGNVVFSTRDGNYCYKEMIAVQRSSENNKQNIPDITIGNQVWMARNLDVDTFRNGDKIFHAKSSKDWDSSIKHKIPAWAYYENDSVKGKIYGRIYNRHVILDPRGISPFGWRLPTNGDWDELKANLSDENERLLKSNNLWMKKSGVYEAKISKHDLQINQAGYNALPGGFRYGEVFWYSKRETGLFGHIGKIAIWWTAPSQEFKDTVFSELVQISIDKPRAIVYSSNKLQSFQYHRGDGFYIRCVKEDEDDKNKLILSNDSEHQSNDNNLDLIQNMKDGRNHVSNFQYTPEYPEFDYLYEAFPENEVPVPTGHTQKENASTSKDIMINRKEWIRLFEKGTYQNQIKKRLLDPTYPYDPQIRFRHKPL